MSEETKQVMGFSQMNPELFSSIFSIMPFLRDFIQSDTTKFLQKINCPLIALYGSKNVQVPFKLNLSSLERMNNIKFILMGITGYNYLFQKCPTGFPSEYLTLEGTMDPHMFLLSLPDG